MAKTSGPGLLIVPYGALLWVVASAASRRNGLLWVLAGLAAWAIAVHRYRRGRPQALYRLCFGMLLAAVTALGIEAVLRLHPSLLQGAVANNLYSRNHVYTGGVYERDKHLGYRMRPGMHALTYWNGYWWRHDANRRGFRGPDLVAADAVVLGDSMIYGHGVETDQTVPARLSALTGRPVANLGEAATALVQASMLLREKGLPLRPRIVFVCSHPNDLDDNRELYEDGELRRFVGEPGYLPVVKEKDLWPRPWYDLFELWTRHVGLPLRSSGLAGTLAKAAWTGTLKLRHGGAAVRPAPRFLPPDEYVALPFAPLLPGASEKDRLEWQVHRQAVSVIHRMADAIGARVVLLDIGYPTAFSEAIEGLAREEGVGYNPAGRVILARARAGEELYLRDDGHWTPAGAEAMARELQRSW
jgi:hypothetical protein